MDPLSKRGGVSMVKNKTGKEKRHQQQKQKRTAKAKSRAKAAKAKAHLSAMPDDEFDDLPTLPDPRSMEGFMSGIFGREGSGSIDEAQTLMYDAWEASSQREAVELAHQALAISPDCADAYNLLAEETARSLEEAAAMYRKGVEAGERALGPKTFNEDVGHFWGLLETRPYMRARSGLADCLWQLGEKTEAVEHYQSLLRLNPNDNQGIRYVLAPKLFELKRLEELEELLQQYDEDSYAGWPYIKALLLFSKEGDTPTSRKLLVDAVKANPHVPAFLLGRKQMPRNLPSYMGIGDENEAIAFMVDNSESWKMTPGALNWLKKSQQQEVAVVVSKRSTRQR
jgi:tetratricopeptide (TPR) repeat protein